MGILTDLLEREVQFAYETRSRLGEREVAIEAIIDLAQLTARYDAPIAEFGTREMARLLLDATVSIEQAFICAFRAQPRLGWASTRIAAEACKDLECLRVAPKLVPLWLAVGSAKTRRDTTRAHEAYTKARKGAPKTDVIERCISTMRVCSTIGSHANATALYTMGPMQIDLGERRLTMPVRVTDPDVLDSHIAGLMFHGGIIAKSVAGLRILSLSVEQHRELEQTSAGLDAMTWPDVDPRMK